MAAIALATINIRFHNTSLGLRYLKANMGAYIDETVLHEFTLPMRVPDMAETLLEGNPTIIGFGIYIWNATVTLELIKLLKKIRPEIKIIAGGPEVSYDIDAEFIRHTDYIICGDGELCFAQLCEELLQNRAPEKKILSAGNTSLEKLHYPYDYYTAQDIAHRQIMLEASRGCPFGCHFCLSARNPIVSYFPLESFLQELSKLWERGARHFRFIDRSFNLRDDYAKAILNFFHTKKEATYFVHLEMVPRILSAEWINLLKEFPSGALQLEIGVQTFNEEVATRIGRKQKNSEIKKCLEQLKQHTSAHLHTDLILGLPGEDLYSIQKSFDKLRSLGPHEIQVGILKKLRGAPISQHDQAWDMIYSPSPPYEIMESKTLTYKTLQRLKRFARFWDLYGNSGRFTHSLSYLWQGESFFFGFFRFYRLAIQKSRKNTRACP